jgi:hypothetical protein
MWLIVKGVSRMDDSDGVIILIFISAGLGVLILATILSGLVLDFGDKFNSTIFIGELIAIGILVAGVLKIRSDLSF